MALFQTEVKKKKERKKKEIHTKSEMVVLS